MTLTIKNARHVLDPDENRVEFTADNSFDVTVHDVIIHASECLFHDPHTVIGLLVSVVTIEIVNTV